MVCPGLPEVVALKRHKGILSVPVVSWEEKAHPGGGAQANKEQQVRKLVGPTEERGAASWDRQAWRGMRTANV